MELEVKVKPIKKGVGWEIFGTGARVIKEVYKGSTWKRGGRKAIKGGRKSLPVIESIGITSRWFEEISSFFQMSSDISLLQRGQ